MIGFELFELSIALDYSSFQSDKSATSSLMFHSSHNMLANGIDYGMNYAGKWQIEL